MLYLLNMPFAPKDKRRTYGSLESGLSDIFKLTHIFTNNSRISSLQLLASELTWILNCYSYLPCLLRYRRRALSVKSSPGMTCSFPAGKWISQNSCGYPFNSCLVFPAADGWSDRVKNSGNLITFIRYFIPALVE